MSEPGEEDRKRIQQYHKEKMEKFELLSDEDLVEKIKKEYEKGMMEEEVRGDEVEGDLVGGTTSETNWNINVLRDIAEGRGLNVDE